MPTLTLFAHFYRGWCSVQHVAGSGTLLQTHPHQCAQLVSLVMNVYPFDVKPLFKVLLVPRFVFRD
jgi:hypothetical protein